MSQTPEEIASKKITSRLKRSRGQLDAVMRMMDEDKPCDQVLMQLSAVKSSVDKAMKLGLNHPMGPLELADLVGLDTRLRNMEYLYATLGEKYRPCPLIVKYVKAGRLGKKSGKGFYDYT